MSNYLFVCRAVFAGKSLIRATLDLRLLRERLSGNILDLGSGGSDRYSDFIPREPDSKYELFDVKNGAVVDFEKDALNYNDNQFDTVILLNVLEHLYNYKNILTEIKRIKKDQGVLVGYVPFLIWYHPDPRDYFRYTHESLRLILEETGYTDILIEPIFRGPYTAAFQMIYPTMPRWIRPLPFSIAWGLDAVFIKIRKKAAERYALGYYFKAK